MTLWVWALLCLAATPGGEIEGEVESRDGTKVAEARLVLYGANRAVVDSTDTDQAGRFRIPPVAPGSYVLEARAQGFVPLQHPLLVDGPVSDLVLQLEPRGEDVSRTIVRGDRSPLATDGTSGSTLGAEQIRELPGGSTRQVNDVVATEPGITRDNFGVVHVRGNFAGLQTRVDGVALPPSIQSGLQQLFDGQIVSRVHLLTGGLPAEFGQQVAGVVDIETAQLKGSPTGEVQLSYGTNAALEGQARAGGSVGVVSWLAAGNLETTNRGLDPPAASPIFHDQLQDGRAFLRASADLSTRDRVEVLGIFAQSHYQIPIDPTVFPLSAGPPGASRGTDGYGNTPPGFVPSDSNPSESEQDVFAAVSWTHQLAPGFSLRASPFFRAEQSQLRCDTAHELSATADPGSTCSDVSHRVLQAGAAIDVTWTWERHNVKVGALVDAQRSTVDYSEYFRDDLDPAGGANSGLTASGQDIVNLTFGGVYVQDRIALGKLTVFPGLRLDVEQASLVNGGLSSTLSGPSVRLGASYAFSDALVAHAFVGQLWQPPSFDGPTAARVLGLVAPGSPVPFDLQGETDEYAEVGLSARFLRRLTVNLTPWGRLSRNTLDDNEVGDTALTADYNYARGRAAGVDAALNVTWDSHVRAFANATLEVAEGAGIATARYLFSPQQLAFSGYQTVDNAQLLTANAGVVLTDGQGATHLSGTVGFGSGLRTGPTNNATLPPYAVVDLSLRHRFELPLTPEVALDVRNLFDVIYAYRIATGSLAGSAYAPLRTFMVRLLVPIGGAT